MIYLKMVDAPDISISLLFFEVGARKNYASPYLGH
jgi:hypothetical protein